MEVKKVVVTGIGGNVGQGIIRNIRATGYPIEVIGTNISDFSAGNHLCDHFEKLPYAFDENYISEVQKIVDRYKPDLIIPSTDYEVYYLSKSSDKIHCKVAASPWQTSFMYLDKYETWLGHSKHGIPFADSCLPSEFIGQYEQYIVKPRKGRGSRGLHINPSNVQSFEDHEYMVQKLAKGKEYTTAFYITQSNDLLGLITLERALENGATQQCKVNTSYDVELKDIITRMKNQYRFTGAANLQFIVDEKGQIIPFEVNCRISGTNSIRSNFGFEDVKYTLMEHLYNLVPETPKITAGVAVRILMDVIYQNAEEYNALKDNKSPYYIY